MRFAWNCSPSKDGVVLILWKRSYFRSQPPSLRGRRASNSMVTKANTASLVLSSLSSLLSKSTKRMVSYTFLLPLYPLHAAHLFVCRLCSWLTDVFLLFLSASPPSCSHASSLSLQRRLVHSSEGRWLTCKYSHTSSVKLNWSEVISGHLFPYLLLLYGGGTFYKCSDRTTVLFLAFPVPFFSPPPLHMSLFSSPEKTFVSRATSKRSILQPYDRSCVCQFIHLFLRDHWYHLDSSCQMWQQSLRNPHLTHLPSP